MDNNGSWLTMGDTNILRIEDIPAVWLRAITMPKVDGCTFQQRADLWGFHRGFRVWTYIHKQAGVLPSKYGLLLGISFSSILDH